jgi:hypothetical protein
MAAPSTRAQQLQTDDAVTLTVLNDALSDGDPRGEEAVSQLLRQQVPPIDVRIQPVAGQGSLDNLRDLLGQKGIDVAIVNSDELAFLELRKELAQPRKKLRQLVHLFDQRVFVLARNNIQKLSDLAGRRVGAFGRDRGGYATARVILGLERIDAQLERLTADALAASDLKRFDAIILLDHDLKRITSLDPTMRLLPIAVTPALATAYAPAAVESYELPALTLGRRIETLGLSTILAAAVTPATQGRVVLLERFAASIYRAMPALRSEPQSIWRQSDPRIVAAGWRLHDAGKPARWVQGADLEQLAIVDVARAELSLGQEPPPPRELPRVGAVPPPPPVPVAAVSPVAPRPGASSPASGAAPAVADAGSGATPDLMLIAREPLSDPSLSNGGVVVELLSRALVRSGASGKPQSTWVSSPEAVARAMIAPGARANVSAPWESVDCDKPDQIGPASKALCEGARMSEPLMQVVVGLFALTDSPLAVSTEAMTGKTVCLAEDRDPSILDRDGRNWVSGQIVTLLKRPTLIDCAVVVQTGEAAAFVANDLEGQLLLNKLGLGSQFKMLAPHLGTRGIHAAVARSNPQAESTIAAIDRGIGELKKGDDYAAILSANLMAVWMSRQAAAGAPAAVTAQPATPR